MIAAKGEFFSPRRLDSTTMVLRRMTELGWLEMSLSKKGLPYYTITSAGEAAVLADW